MASESSAQTSARDRGVTPKPSARVAAALRAFWTKSYQDGLTGLAGMVAYNLLLSLLPLTLLVLFIFGRVVRSPDVQTSVIADVHRILPSTRGHDLHGLLVSIRNSSTSIGIAAVVSSIWVGASFWGALDTAFCRIYHCRCRSWLEQKRFALAMLVVVIALFASTVAVPALQSAVVSGADNLPFGLDAGRTTYAITLVTSVVALFALLCLIYRVVPNERVRWRGVWPGALGATFAIAVLDYGFPFYLSESTITSFGGTYVFVLIVLVWFYAVAIVLLAGAVINALRVMPAPD
jgi:membrane protein